jgi:hypothetical protein
VKGIDADVKVRLQSSSNFNHLDRAPLFSTI